jgi:hypothetical protein
VPPAVEPPVGETLVNVGGVATAESEKIICVGTRTAKLKSDAEIESEINFLVPVLILVRKRLKFTFASFFFLG